MARLGSPVAMGLWCRLTMECSMRRSWRTVLVALGAVAALCGGLAQPAQAGVPSPATAAADAQTVFRMINRERAAHHLAPLRWNDKLASVARAHDAAMAAHNMLTHQVPGEPPVGAAITAAGYRWLSIGENIAAGADMTLTGVLNMHRFLYREAAPQDPHRRNVLNRAFRAVGIDVRMDGTHSKVWLTEIFAQPR